MTSLPPSKRKQMAEEEFSPLATDTDRPDFIEIEPDRIEHLTGLTHLCPLCFRTLGFRPMPGLNEHHWFCKGCGTEWEVEALIYASNFDELSGEDYNEQQLEPATNGEAG
jgi:hypothetical protein